MAGKVLEIQNLVGEDTMAVEISNKFLEWNQQRDQWLEEKKELRNFIFATDTTKTSNSSLPWKNKTTLPKLCQIRDNLHANYMAALFPNDDWLMWEGDDQESESREKKRSIHGYISNKIRVSDFKETISRLVYDFIDYGNAFADVVYVNETTIVNEDEEVTTYVGPRVVRISPVDIVFNPTAPDFHASPKITRFIKGLGELEKESTENADLQYQSEVVDKMRKVRSEIQSNNYSQEDLHKAMGFSIDGFGDLKEYYDSGLVELLEFEGSIYDEFSGKLMENRLITVVDRRYVIRNIPHPSYLGASTKVHVGWRLRPDNLYAMGPLDNLVGMQYRIDHLENLKADVFDLIATPPLVIKGEVDEFQWGPNAEIFVGEDGSVSILQMDATALNADLQINQLENKMEEMAGAPREAMGIRTPGEKTAFEIQSLQNAAGRIFQDKVSYFESMFLEKLLNMMLEISVRNLNGKDVVRQVSGEFGAVTFMDITKEDIQANGKLRPIGARHFAATAQLLQNLTGVFGGPMGQMLLPHTSTKGLATMVEDVLGVERYSLFRENVGVVEQAETEALARTSQDELGVQDTVQTEEEI